MDEYGTVCSTGVRAGTPVKEGHMIVSCPDCGKEHDVPISAVVALICTKCDKMFNGRNGAEIKIKE